MPDFFRSTVRKEWLKKKKEAKIEVEKAVHYSYNFVSYS